MSDLPVNQIICGDNLETMRTWPSNSVHCCVTSPPYWGLRDYGHDGQIGLEDTPEAYVAKMVEVFREVRRVLRDDGTLWLNLGDSYASTGGDLNKRKPGFSITGHARLVEEGGARPGNRVPPPGLKPKDLVGIPWRVAFALQADGWWLRQDIIWHKPNPMPESVTDRCTKANEYVFLLTKSERYFYDAEAVKEPSQANDESKKRAEYGRYDASDGTAKRNTRTGKPDYLQAVGNDYGGESRNKRDVWTVATHPYKGAHFATFPPKLIEPCILAGTSEEGCCPACGTPWERVVEREGDGTRQAGNARALAMGHTSYGLTACMRAGEPATSRTTGWRPGCECGGEPVPCTVLDPFGGSGTTAEVALKLGRRAMLIELNPDYVDMQTIRAKSQTPAERFPLFSSRWRSYGRGRGVE